MPCLTLITDLHWKKKSDESTLVLHVCQETQRPIAAISENKNTEMLLGWRKWQRAHHLITRREKLISSPFLILQLAVFLVTDSLEGLTTTNEKTWMLALERYKRVLCPASAYAYLTRSLDGSTGGHTHSPLFRDMLPNGACAHYIMVSQIQWKPFWLATQFHSQTDWAT